MVTIHDLAAQLLLHSLTSALVVEALIRRLPITDPTTRVRYRTLVLVLPLVFLPVAWLAPDRLSIASWHRMLFFSPSWEAVRFGGVGLRSAGLGVAALVGLSLLVRDAHRIGHAWRRDRHARRIGGGRPASGDTVMRTVQTMAERAGITVPEVCLVDTDAPILSCHGVRRPRIAVSRAMAATLPAPQLESVIAHEVAHVARRDVAINWVVLVLRALQWFNPLAHLMGRRLGQELEWRADDDAVRMTGSATPIVRALVASARARGAEFLGLLGRGRIHAVEERCQRLLHPTWDQGLPAGHLAYTTAIIVLVFWFVV